MADEFKKANFDPHLNTTFEVHTEAKKKVPFKLVKISDLSRDNIEGFSLLFRGPQGEALPQKIYKLSHAKMGKQDIFIVPVLSQKTDGVYYEAVFSRLVDKK